MNEELHHLLDGELPDAATVEFLRTLAENREERTAFRQQIQLQGALYRNSTHASLTSGEEGEMFARVNNAIGANEVRPRGGAFWGRVAAVCLLVGGGLGYTAHELLTAPPPATAILAPVPVLIPNQLDSVRLIDLDRDTVADQGDSATRKVSVSSRRRASAKRVVKRRTPGVTTGSEFVQKRNKPR